MAKKLEELSDQELLQMARGDNLDSLSDQELMAQAESLGYGKAQTSAPEAAARGAAQGLPFIGTFVDEAESAIRALYEAKNEEGYLEAYKRIRDLEVRPEYAMAAKEHPWLYGLSELSVGVITGGLLAKGGVKLATKFAPEFIAGIIGDSKSDAVEAIESARLDNIDSIQEYGKKFAKEAGTSVAAVVALGTAGKIVKGALKGARSVGEVAGIADSSGLFAEAFKQAKKGLSIHTGKKAIRTAEHLRGFVNEINTQILEKFQKTASTAKIAKSKVLEELDLAYKHGLPREEIQKLYEDHYNKLLGEMKFIPDQQKDLKNAANKLELIYESLLFKKDAPEVSKKIKSIYRVMDKESGLRRARLDSEISRDTHQAMLVGTGEDELISKLAKDVREGSIIKSEAYEALDIEAYQKFKPKLDLIFNKNVKKVTGKELDTLRADMWELLNYGKAKIRVSGQDIHIDVPTTAGIKTTAARKHYESFIGGMKGIINKHAGDFSADGKTYQSIEDLNKIITENLKLKKLAEKHGIRDYSKLRTLNQSKSLDKAAVLMNEIKEVNPAASNFIEESASEVQGLAEILEAAPSHEGIVGKLFAYGPKYAAPGLGSGIQTRVGSLAGDVARGTGITAPFAAAAATTAPFIKRNTEGMLENMDFYSNFLSENLPQLHGEFISAAHANDKETLASLQGDMAAQTENFLEPSPIQAKGVRIKSAIESPRTPGAYKITNPMEQNILRDYVMEDKGMSNAEKLDQIMGLNEDGVYQPPLAKAQPEVQPMTLTPMMLRGK